MNKPLILSAFFTITVAMTATHAQAEILAIGPNAKVLSKAHLPKHGQSMKFVSKTFGVASRVIVSKGKVTKRNPKITRWDYPSFSVFFENAHVIHSVVRK